MVFSSAWNLDGNLLSGRPYRVHTVVNTSDGFDYEDPQYRGPGKASGLVDMVANESGKTVRKPHIWARAFEL